MSMRCMRQIMIKQSVIFLLISILTSSLAFALPEDTKKPIRIKAMKSQYDNNNGFLTYQGNVEFNQGSIQIKAERIEITLLDGNITMAEAQGDPAIFIQDTDTDGSQVIAQGALIRYLVAEHALEIFEGAQLSEGNNKMSGGEIYYNLDNNLANISGDPSVGDGRMEMIFTPASQDSE